jgi:hypothetical protein
LPSSQAPSMNGHWLDGLSKACPCGLITGARDASSLWMCLGLATLSA